MNYLLIVEGAKAEHSLFEMVFKRYGFNILHSQQMKSFDSFINQFDSFELSDSKDNIVIAQAPRNRLGELLRSDSSQVDFDLAFRKKFNSIFLIFDVDHTDNNDLEEMLRIHCDESDSGLLLVSSPCIEIMSEPNRKEELETDHLTKYKKERNVYFCDTQRLGYGAIEYIARNFERLSLEFLRQNYNDFNEPNIMEHPRLVIEMINRHNIRTDSHVKYRYFTTVLYVVIASVFGLTKEIENYDVVERFLQKIMNYNNGKERELV